LRKIYKMGSDKLFMIRGDKRGQSEGIGLGTILALVIGLAAVIVVFLFLSGTFGTLTNLPGSAVPSSVSVAVSSCKLASGNDLLWTSGAYCGISRIVQLDSGDDMNVNCKYLKDNLGGSDIPEIEGESCEGIEKSYCNTQNIGDVDLSKIYVNGKTCSDWVK
jgi:hypothetical protein